MSVPTTLYFGWSIGMKTLQKYEKKSNGENIKGENRWENVFVMVLYKEHSSDKSWWYNLIPVHSFNSIFFSSTLISQLLTQSDEI